PCAPCAFPTRRSSDLKAEIRELEEYIGKFNGKLHPIYVDNLVFNELPVSHHFTIEAYYRFLAQSMLPNTVERVLYLDPDVLITEDRQGTRLNCSHVSI